MEDLISVIIPVYNAAPYLERCLNSIINNTYKNLQIIGINDGSTDNSLEILQKFASKDSRITALNQKNGGVSAARNAGMEIAEGDYVAFVDSDDWVHRQYFERLIMVAKETKADLVICSNKSQYALTVDEKLSDFSSLIFQKLDQTNFVNDFYAKSCVWARIYRKEIVDGRYFEESINFAEDRMFNLDVICNNLRMTTVVIDEKLYYYFQRPDSAVHSLSAEHNLPLARKLYERLKQSKNNDEIKKVYLMEMIARCLSAKYMCMFLSNKKQITEECNEMLGYSVRELWKNKVCSSKEKIVYSVFGKSLFVYRMFRILTDRTMLEWEKNQKRLYKN